MYIESCKKEIIRLCVNAMVFCIVCQEYVVLELSDARRRIYKFLTESGSSRTASFRVIKIAIGSANKPRWVFFKLNAI